jgi:hypothetical protein
MFCMCCKALNVNLEHLVQLPVACVLVKRIENASCRKDVLLKKYKCWYFVIKISIKWADWLSNQLITTIVFYANNYTKSWCSVIKKTRVVVL